MIKDKIVAIESLKKHLFSLDLIDTPLWSDKEFINDVLDIVFINTYVMRKKYSIHIGKKITSLKDDDSIAEKMVRIYIGLYEFLNQSQKDRPEIEKILVDCTEGTGLMYVKEERKTKDLVLESIKNNIDNYDYIPDFLKSDEEILKTVAKGKNIFSTLKAEQINNTDLMCELVKSTYNLLKLKDKMSIFEKSELIREFDAIFKNRDFLEAKQEIGFLKELNNVNLKDNINMSNITIIKSNNFNEMIDILPVLVESIENKKLKNELLKEIPLRNNKTKLKF